MRFVYPARLRRASADEIVVSFRDLPECLTSGKDESEALFEAQDALEEAIAGRMNRVDCIPIPSPRKNGETAGSRTHRYSRQSRPCPCATGQRSLSCRVRQTFPHRRGVRPPHAQPAAPYII